MTGLDENVCLPSCCIYLHSAAAHTIDNDCIPTTTAVPVITDNDITLRRFSNPEVQRSRCFQIDFSWLQKFMALYHGKIYKFNKTCSILRRKLCTIFKATSPRHVFRVHCRFCPFIQIIFKLFL